MKTKVLLSNQAEDYLEEIFRLEKKSGPAKTMELVKRLSVVPGSVTNTIERLERRGLVIHEPYRGVKLTEKGRKIAINVLRRHRLAERLLTDFLHLDWSEVHKEACKIEHALSPQILNSMENALGYPKTCPHGNPIPSKRGKLIGDKTKPLTELNQSEEGVIVKIDNEKPENLKILGKLNLFPESHIKVERKGTRTTPLIISIDGEYHNIDLKLAVQILVKPSKKFKEEKHE